MSLISQTIKNLKGGISQQPDILRFPDQGTQQVNGWSSEANGLQKRPPMCFIKTLGDASILGSAPLVHLINRDEREQYYAVFTGKDIKVFDLKGNQKEVRYPNGKTYMQVKDPRDDLRMVTVADYTFVVNRRMVVRKDPSKVNLQGFNPKKDALINVRGGQYGRTLKVGINGKEVASHSTPDGSNPDHARQTDSQWIADRLAGQLRSNLPGWTISVGQGHIHIVAPEGQQIDSFMTKDGQADQLIAPVTHYTQTFAKLPVVAPEGYIVKIVGDNSKASDQYYVQYDSERKLWKEVLGWDLEYSLDFSTMPHALVRASDGNFEFKPLEWKTRGCGDDETNPWPSFVDSTLNDVFFYRNRLGFLSGENIILSRTAKYFNFFPPSVANLSDDDPIDVAVSVNRVAILKYAVPFSEELLIWSDEAQFVLTSAGPLSARSIELNLTTQFDVQDKARPFSVGRNVYFASARASFTSINRYYAVQDVSSVKDAEDITSHVASYIPNGVFSISGSGTEKYCAVLTSGASGKIFIYKFLYVGDDVRQQAWSHWDFGPEVQVVACQSIGSDMYVLMRNKYSSFLSKVSFTKSTVDYTGEPYRVYLDFKVPYIVPKGTYDGNLAETHIDLTRVYKASFVSGKVSVVERDGKIHEFMPPPEGWAVDSVLRLSGNVEDALVFIGFNIHFFYEFSKFLIKRASDDGSISTEDNGRLQLRRAWVNYEESGSFDVHVTNQSSAWKYTMAGARIGSNNLRVDRLNLGTGQYRFPVAGNAKHLTVHISSDETTPLSIIGCGWEGKYMRRSSGI